MKFLTIKNDKLILEVDSKEIEIVSKESLTSLLMAIGPVMCSSSVDFPEEFTNNQNVIAMCNALRND